MIYHMFPYHIFPTSDIPVADDEPRKLFRISLEEEISALEVKKLGLGITNLVIKQHDNGNVTLKVLIGVQPEDVSMFDVGTWEESHERGIDITIQPYGREERGRRVPGLFQLGRVGFYGYEIDADRYKLFTKNINVGTILLLKKLFELFPKFLDHYYVSIPETAPNTLLYDLVYSREFKKVKNVTFMRKMTEKQVAMVKEGLGNSETINYSVIDS